MQIGRVLLVAFGVASVACTPGLRSVTPNRAISPGGAQASDDTASMSAAAPPSPGAASSTLSAPSTPSSAPKKRVVVIAGRLFDAKAAKLVAGPQAIVIEADRIVSVGAAAGVQPVAGEARIDLSGATVLPGLIDVHTHLTSNPEHIGFPSLGISVPREALFGAKNARVTLEAGFTTVRNVGAGGYSDVALREAIDAGDLPGPRIQASGPPLGITGGHCDENLLPYEYQRTAEGVADGVEG